MSMTFFSVDVETTSTNPFTGQLLTVGIVPIDGGTLEVGEGIHVPIEYDTDGPIDQDTYDWWKQQDVEVFDVAWGQERISKDSAAKVIDTYVRSFSDELKNRVFCANPVSFDHPWLSKLFAEAEMEMPWHHRTVCMRSMYYGITGGVWGESREAGNWNYPEYPHHALFDAKAQALDFVKMYMMTHVESRPTVNANSVTDVYD